MKDCSYALEISGILGIWWLIWEALRRVKVFILLSRSGVLNDPYEYITIGIIANFVVPDSWSFLFYLQHMMLVNMKLDISRSNRITFQGSWLHWSIYFLIVQPKWSWQYWHSYIVEILWKTLLRSNLNKFEHTGAYTRGGKAGALYRGRPGPCMWDPPRCGQNDRRAVNRRIYWVFPKCFHWIQWQKYLSLH